MKRAKIKLPQQSWGSTVTKYAPDHDKVGIDAFTEGTKNIDTYLRGDIAKREAPIDYGTPEGPIKDQYEAKFSDGTHHMLVMGAGKLQYSSGSGTFNTVTSGYSTIGNMEFASYSDRVYFGNGISAPQVYDRTAVYGGATPVAVPKTRDMGVQAPVAAPTTALAVDSTANQVPAGAHTYKVTFTYYDSEESNGSPASTPAVTTDGTHTSVSLTNIPVGGYGVTARNIYRDDADGVWRLVGFISNNTATTYTDKASIGTSVIPADNNPPRNWSLVVEHGDRLWMSGIAGDPSAIDFSEASQPDIVLSTNTILCNPSDTITGLVVYNDRVVVFNRNSFGQVFGTTADTFRYAEVPGSIGCVDNRTIQVRTINGVPVLLWLSAKGFYAFNGSTVDYISDDIEDQVRFNLQQANQVKGSNSISTQSDFQAGTSSTGIDTNVIPGSLTTRGQLLNGAPTNNPLESFDTQAEWENPSASGAIVTRLASLQNKLASAVKTAVKPSTSTMSGLEAYGGDMGFRTIPGIEETGYRGYDSARIPAFIVGSNDNSTSATLNGTKVVAKWTFTRAGIIDSLKARVVTNDGLGSGCTGTYHLIVMSDLGGLPGSVVYTDPTAYSFSTTGGIRTDTIEKLGISVAVSAGQSMWIGISKSSNQPNNMGTALAGTTNLGIYPGYENIKFFNINGLWADTNLVALPTFRGSIFAHYVQTAVPASGTFTSQIIDTGMNPHSDSITIQNVGSDVMSWGGTGSKSGTITVEQADSNDMLIGLVSSTPVVNPTQTQSYVFSLTKRYWRIRGTLQTADDRSNAALPWFYFVPPATATWESQAIDCSADVTSYDAPTEVTTIASGGQATLEAATSDDNSSYSAYGPVGAAVVKRYIKFRYTLSTGSTGLVPSYVTSLTFSYKLSSTWSSPAIDLGAAPEGWDVLQTSDAVNGGTLTYELRSAATSGGLGAASYFTVTAGTFPNTVPLNRWIQYRVSISSEANKVPVVQSITTNWFIKLVNSVRAASLFYFRTYYVCLAEYNNTTNNLMLVFDPDGKWRIHRDLNAATFGFFFQDPYYGDAVDGKIKKLLGGIDQVVKLDVRTKAFDFDDVTKLKVFKQAYLVVGNTGASYSAFISTDQGVTFKPLVDAKGLTIWTVPDDGGKGITSKRLVPDWSDPTGITGKTIMFRVTEETTKQAQIQEIHVDTYIRDRGEIIDG